MAEHLIGIGGHHVTDKHGDILKTLALGSCVAVMLYDAKNRVAAMAHVALAKSADRTVDLPCRFVDTCLPVLLKQMALKGSTRRTAWIKIVGGAHVMPVGFNIGQNNIKAIREFFEKKNLVILAADVGGKIPRTVSLAVDTGEIVISSAQKKWYL